MKREAAGDEVMIEELQKASNLDAFRLQNDKKWIQKYGVILE